MPILRRSASIYQNSLHMQIMIVFCLVHYTFFGVPHLATYIFFLFVNEPELGTLINLTLVALIPFPSSVG